jgi:hypothetical protein
MSRFVVVVLTSGAMSPNGTWPLQCVLPTLLAGKGGKNEGKTWTLANNINERGNMEIIS